MSEEKNLGDGARQAMPLISVIVPVYKVEKYLPHCVESILAQSYFNLEIILVDDGSPDRCGEICDNYAKKDPRIKVIHKENGGLSSARNAGLDCCQGGYVSFIDSDDFVSPYFIEILYKGISRFESDVAVLRVDAVVNFTDAAENEVRFASGVQDCTVQSAKPADVIRQIFYGKVSTGFQDYLFKRDLFRDFRLPDGWLYEDTASIHCTVMKAERVTVVDARIYAYRIRGDSIMRMKFSEKKLDAIKAAEKVVSDIRAYDESLLPAACSRAFALVYAVFMQVPVSDRVNMKKLWHSMLLYRNAAAWNDSPEARLKDRAGARCTYLGMNVSYLLGNVYRILNNRRIIKGASDGHK